MTKQQVEHAFALAGYLADQIKVREEGGTNRGPMVDDFNVMAGAPLGSPWCASSLTWCFRKSGVPRSELPVLAASVAGWRSWARDHGRLIPKPVSRGIGLYVDPDTNRGHIWMVARVVGPLMFTLEGNTNVAGSREGTRFMRRIRRVTKAMEFIRLVDE